MNVLNECSGASKCEALENSSIETMRVYVKTGVKVSRGEEPSYRVCEVTEFARLNTVRQYTSYTPSRKKVWATIP